jgi:seryl-tRNA synthetase
MVRAATRTQAAPGIPLSNSAFETIIDAFHGCLTRMDPAGGDIWRTPPVVARALITEVGYGEYFPHLLGSVHVAAESGEISPTDLVLLPAGCYCIYPHYRGRTLMTPVDVGVEAICFRQESSHEVGRLRSFRMREFVHLDTELGCFGWRDEWLNRAEAWLSAIGLAPVRELASDPFFGAQRKVLAAMQRDQALKWELVVEVGPGIRQAVMSGNVHKTKFGDTFNITGPGGEAIHSACAAFGSDRLALALIHTHGPDPSAWPDTVRAQLILGGFA